VFRSLLLFAVLGLSLAGAKTFEITLDQPAKAGSVVLKAGKYNLLLMEDSKVRFTSANGQAVETSAKMSTAEKKFSATQIDLRQNAGSAQINEIDLGGTKTKIQFE
jgi:cytochrome c biogenesis protein ResB